jgi:tetratricopeptide (TPR) repeat protein
MTILSAEHLEAEAARQLAADNTAEAARNYRRAGTLHAAAGRASSADAAFTRYFELLPDAALVAEAAERHQDGNHQAALAGYDAVLRRSPDHVDALRLKGVALSQLRQFEQAEKALRRAVEIAPDFPVAWSNLGGLLSEMDRPEAATEAYRRALALDPDNPHMHFNLANALVAADDQVSAAGAYEAALARQPDHPGALIGLGHVLKTLGHQKEAIDAYRKCLSISPAYGEVWWSLANLKTYRFSDDEITRMETVLASAAMAEEASVSVEFALGKAFEDHKDYDQAFSWYANGAARQRQRVAYDPVQTEAINDRIVETFDADFFAEREGWGHDDSAPIFIVGLPRSGSTLIEQILASHSLVDGTSELPELGRLAISIGKFRSDGVTYPEAVRALERADCRTLGRNYIERTRRHRGGAVFFTDKMPNNFPTIGLIRLILPRAKVIDARRHPLDSCMGAFKQLFAGGQAFSYDLFELGEYYRQYVRMMDWWHRTLPGFTLQVDYETMVADQERQTRRLLEFCGLPFEEQCLHFHETERAVKTASSEQVRQPIYTGSIGSWRRFHKHLEPLERQLADILERWPDEN